MKLNTKWAPAVAVALLLIVGISFKSAKADAPILRQSRAVVVIITYDAQYNPIVERASVGGDDDLIINQGDALGKAFANIHAHGMILQNVNGPFYTFISP